MTMKRLAQLLDISYGRLKIVLAEMKGSPPEDFRGYKLLKAGEGKRGQWLAYKDDEIEIQIEEE